MLLKTKSEKDFQITANSTLNTAANLGTQSTSRAENTQHTTHNTHLPAPPYKHLKTENRRGHYVNRLRNTR
jgi:hypothetical protein